MKTKGWLISIVLSFALVAGGGFAILAMQLKKSEASQLPLKTAENPSSKTPKLLAEIIVSQLQSGSFSCPKDDLLTYEACLIFQGTLGIWERAGLTKHCPDMISPIQHPVSQAKKVVITPQAILGATKSPCFGYFYAINVANTVPILISTSNRTFQMVCAPDFLKSGSDAELSIFERHGTCGNQSALATAFFKRAGFKARPVEFYYEYEGSRHSHITPEVWVDGDWRLIDSTYGAYWIDRKSGVSFELMPTEKILARKAKTYFYNSALLPFGFRSVISNTNYFSYISEKADVVRGGSGEITLTLKGQQGSENFLHKPNFVGDNIPEHQSDGIQFRLLSKNAKYRLTVNVSAASIPNDAKAFLCIDESCQKYSDEKREYSFIVKNPSKLHLKTDADYAYAVLKSLDWKVVSN